ncbi:MAG: hypothetical protein KKF89_00365 [Nanoarchaeota archaeon]|nr:hypothetical protein [Patescibacteria group bacterium]MBU1854149.1 hypothetical protein [Nanoarchaeota archaeon]
MTETVLGGTLAFLNELGLYDVILPFLLAFTIIFAILEKTKIFGTEKIGDVQVTRKNMNAMVAFVIAFFVVASSKVVALINMVASQAFLLVFLFVLFLILAGVLQKEGEYELEKGWRNAFMIVALIVLILIFLNAIGWLSQIYEFLVKYWDSQAVSAVILLILIVLFMAWITKSKTTKKDDKEKKGD